jgi:hypothetical protein
VAVVDSNPQILKETSALLGVENTFISVEDALGVQPDKIILFHIDKRPDLGLHQALAQEDVLLE